MRSVDKKFPAVASEVGDLDGQEQDAAICWNKYVAPALLRLYENRADEIGDDSGLTDNIQHLAWEQFCGTHDDESWDELGRRVAAFVATGRGN